MKKPLLIIIGIAVIGALAVLAGWYYVNNKKADSLKKEQATQNLEKENRSAGQSALIEIIQEVFKQVSPATRYSIGIYDLKHDEYFGYEDTKAQHAASVSKVLTAVYVYDQVEKGKAEVSDPLGAYNIETQLQFMINQSSQDSWDLLDERFKPSLQTVFAKEIGLEATNINIGKNVMSVKDAAFLLKKLAKGELLSEQNREMLFRYMQNTESENYFSAAFKNSGVPFYHKTGKFIAKGNIGEGHDAAIVEHPDNPFVLVVFTQNSTNPNPDGRGPIMVKVAELVLGYFESLD